MEEYKLFTFDNGIQFLHKQANHTRIAHCGFFLDIGSRDEQFSEQGIAHFWEHMAFKGTHKRKAYHILNRIDSVGGELNAYTTREKICFYASLLSPHFRRAAELLTDIVFFSTFPEKEIEKEKSVILEEMAMYEDDPNEDLQDRFDALVFEGHPLGRKILGSRETVKNFSQRDFFNFIAENQNTEKISFCYVGPQPFAKVLRQLEPMMEKVEKQLSCKKRLPFEGFLQRQEVLKKPIQQAHCVIGAPAYALNDPNQLPFFFAVNLLGGSGMNSRLNLAVREKYGFVYAIDAQTTAYTDTGLFTLSFATEKKALEKCMRLVQKELRKLCDKPLGSMQLHRSKQQLIGGLAMAAESNLSRMLHMGKKLLDAEKIVPLSEVFRKIEALTPEKIMEVANEKLQPDKMSRLIFLPESAL